MFYQLIIRLFHNKTLDDINSRLDSLLSNLGVEIVQNNSFEFKKNSSKINSIFVIRIIKVSNDKIDNAPIELTKYLRQNLTDCVEVMRILSISDVVKTPLSITELNLNK